jgi:glycogen debranching enzyme
MPVAQPELTSLVRLPREICCDLAAASEREWVVTNGLGGYACATTTGLLTRRYHGLLVAALSPPLRRTLLVAKVDEVARFGHEICELGVNRWQDGAIAPQGQQFLASLRLEGTIPVWTYEFGASQIEKRVWMQHGENTTYVQYRLLASPEPVSLELKVLANYRDHNCVTHAGDWVMSLESAPHGVRVVAFEGATAYYLRSAEAFAEIPSTAAPGGLWYRNFELAEEAARGYDHTEDHLHAATFRVMLKPGDSSSLVFSIAGDASLDSAHALGAERARQRELLARPKFNSESLEALAATAAVGSPTPAPSSAAGAALADWPRQLILAADAFLVRAVRYPASESSRVIAGYPWFGVWSRDTLISLPGLTLATGRPEIARAILRSFAGLIDQGMLPNFFPDDASKPEFNCADAPLWFIEALRQYAESTLDLDLVHDLLPAVCTIIAHYSAGTRFGIHVDPADGLLFAGQAATQQSPATNLTWMDARLNKVPVTPRVGKPVELNALWLNALNTLANFSRHFGSAKAGRDSERKFRDAAERVRTNFARFWNLVKNCCFDVIDGPEGNDAAIRPNQIFAVSLPISGLGQEQQRAVVDICVRELLTSAGVRTLSPDDPNYRGRYEGSQEDRDRAYHQGTVWPWLIGPFVTAHLRIYRDRAAAARMLDSAAPQLSIGGLGSINEVCDGDAPFTPRGCFAQAWSVAELLRAYRAVNSA